MGHILRFKLGFTVLSVASVLALQSCTSGVRRIEITHGSQEDPSAQQICGGVPELNVTGTPFQTCLVFDHAVASATLSQVDQTLKASRVLSGFSLSRDRRVVFLQGIPCALQSQLVIDLRQAEPSNLMVLHHLAEGSCP